MPLTTCPSFTPLPVILAQTAQTPDPFPHTGVHGTPCGASKGYRVYADATEIPIAAIPAVESPLLIVSDEPEQITEGIMANGDVTLYHYKFIDNQPFSGTSAKKVRLLVYHWNNSGIDNTRRFGVYLRNCGQNPIAITCSRGGRFELDSNDFSAFATESLAGALRPYPITGYTLGSTIAIGASQLINDSVRDSATTNDPPDPPTQGSFYGGLFELEIETTGGIGSGSEYGFEIYTVVTQDPDTDVTTVNEPPYVLPVNSPPGAPTEQCVWIGHPRGDWPHAGINVPFADPDNECLSAIDAEDSWVQFTIAQPFVEPYGGDVMHYEGSLDPPYGRSNRILFSVDQHFTIPFENPTESPITVAGYLLSLSVDNVTADPPILDSKLFAGLIRSGDVPRNIQLGRNVPPDPYIGAYRNFVPVFEVEVPAGSEVEPGKAIASFDLQVGAASSGPIALMIQNAGTTSTTTSTTSTTSEPTTTSNTTTSTTETTSSSSSSSTSTTESTTESTSTATSFTTTTLSSTSSTSQTSSTFTDTLTTMPTRPPQ